MSLKKILSILFFLLVLFLLIGYWFIFSNNLEIFYTERDPNFFVNSTNSNLNTSLQFYPNMRFQQKEITYRIHDCPLEQQNQMTQALKILENITILKYLEVNSNEELYITCKSENVVKEDLFVAGEGGPTKIINTHHYNLILQAKILLIKESKCPKPNIAIHELLHTLGFDHSENQNNIMYPIYKCSQEIGEEIPRFLNEIYSIKPLPDLQIQNASARIASKFLNVNFTIMNTGIVSSKPSEVEILASEKKIKTYSFEELEPGAGINVQLNNIAVFNNPKEIMMNIKKTEEEYDYKNNKIKLKN
jgi:hypothetical protein